MNFADTSNIDYKLLFFFLRRAGVHVSGFFEFNSSIILVNLRSETKLQALTFQLEQNRRKIDLIHILSQQCKKQ